jgi:restriction system protein
VDRVASDLHISDDVLNETLPSGGSRFRNQVAWARFYLVREGLLDSSKQAFRKAFRGQTTIMRNT